MFARHAALFVLPIGAATAGLALAVLGLLHVPLAVSLAVVVAAGLVGAIAAHRRGDGTPIRPSLRACVLPLFVAALAIAVVSIPTFRNGFPTVMGQNGDAVLLVGTAELLREAPPTATRPELALDSVPLVWRSKLPIYYLLAAATELGGQDAVATFPTVAAVATGLLAIGAFLLAFHLLGAGTLVATAAMLLVALNGVVLLSAFQPHFNQLWGLFWLTLLLLFGWRFLTSPAARTGVLFALFAAATIFTHPLLLPFPVLFLGAAAWRARREAGGPLGWGAAVRRRVPAWGIAVAAVAAVPVVAVLGRGVWEKGSSAAKVIAPWSSLEGWDSPSTQYMSLARFIGVSDPRALRWVGLALVAAGVVLALRGARPVARTAWGTLVAGGLAIAGYFWVRDGGDLFWFKALSFLGPLILLLAVVGLAGARRWPALVAAIALAALVVQGARMELEFTSPHADVSTLELRTWDAQLPPGASVRIDVPPGGFQEWAWYFLDSRPTSTVNPLRDFFPFPPKSIKADYVLWDRTQQKLPLGAIGRPVHQNARFVVHRLDPRIPGPDLSSRRLRWDVTEASL